MMRIVSRFLYRKGSFLETAMSRSDGLFVASADPKRASGLQWISKDSQLSTDALGLGIECDAKPCLV